MLITHPNFLFWKWHCFISIKCQTKILEILLQCFFLVPVLTQRLAAVQSQNMELHECLQKP